MILVGYIDFLNIKKHSKFFARAFNGLFSALSITLILVPNITNYIRSNIISKFIIAIVVGLNLYTNYVNYNKNNNIKDMKNKISTLEREQENLIEFLDDYSKRFNIYLNKIFEDLNMHDDERISLYKHDERRKEFKIIGRYSINSKYNRYNRSIFPEDEGCLSIAFENKSKIITCLPEYEKDPETYLKLQEQKYDIDREIVKNFNMKSCRYAGYAIADGGEPNKRIAVIVFESVKAKQEEYYKQKLKEFSDKHEEKLKKLILNDGIEPQPDPEFAKQRRL